MDNKSRDRVTNKFNLKFDTKTLVALAMLIAMEIVLNRFLSINAWNMKIGFSFVPIVIGAILFGPIHAAIIGALGDFIGAILFPIGAYFPGFTVTALLMGLVWGFFLHGSTNITKVIISVLINQTILSLCLNTLWISVLYGSPYGPLFVSRIVQTLILIAVQSVVVYALTKVLPRLKGAISI